MITTIQQLLNSGSKSMSVNGSVSSKTFSYTASADTETVTAIVCLLKDEGATNFSNFGALSSLGNGVLIQVVQSGVTRTIATIKDNGDLCTAFSKNQFGNGAILSILSIATPEGFGDTNNCFVGELVPYAPILLRDGDIIQAVIQDNLTSVDVFQMTVNVCLD
jgi:hypothetical protein